jgi:hypothetical protein
MIFNCEFEKGLEYLKKCDGLSEIAGDLVGLGAVKSLTCLNHIFQGKIESACKTGEEALRMAKEIGVMFIQGMAHTAFGASCSFKGLFDEA